VYYSVALDIAGLTANSSPSEELMAEMESGLSAAMCSPIEALVIDTAASPATLGFSAWIAPLWENVITEDLVEQAITTGLEAASIDSNGIGVSALAVGVSSNEVTVEMQVGLSLGDNGQWTIGIQNSFVQSLAAGLAPGQVTVSMSAQLDLGNECDVGGITDCVVSRTFTLNRPLSADETMALKDAMVGEWGFLQLSGITFEVQGTLKQTDTDYLITVIVSPASASSIDLNLLSDWLPGGANMVASTDAVVLQQVPVWTSEIEASFIATVAEQSGVDPVTVNVQTPVTASPGGSVVVGFDVVSEDSQSTITLSTEVNLTVCSPDGPLCSWTTGHSAASIHILGEYLGVPSDVISITNIPVVHDDGSVTVAFAIQTHPEGLTSEEMVSEANAMGNQLSTFFGGTGGTDTFSGAFNSAPAGTNSSVHVTHMALLLGPSSDVISRTTVGDDMADHLNLVFTDTSFSAAMNAQCEDRCAIGDDTAVVLPPTVVLGLDPSVIQIIGTPDVDSDGVVAVEFNVAVTTDGMSPSVADAYGTELSDSLTWTFAGDDFATIMTNNYDGNQTLSISGTSVVAPPDFGVALICEAGVFAAETTRACSTCAPGYITDTLQLSGATTCTPCSSSTFSPVSTEACTTCGAGSHTDLAVGSATCEPCPAGSSCDGSNAITECPALEVSAPGSELCIGDAAGLLLIAQPGSFYWADSNTTYYTVELELTGLSDPVDAALQAALEVGLAHAVSASVGSIRGSLSYAAGASIVGFTAPITDGWLPVVSAELIQEAINEAFAAVDPAIDTVIEVISASVPEVRRDSITVGMTVDLAFDGEEWTDELQEAFVQIVAVAVGVSVENITMNNAPSVSDSGSVTVEFNVEGFTNGMSTAASAAYSEQVANHLESLFGADGDFAASMSATSTNCNDCISGVTPGAVLVSITDVNAPSPSPSPNPVADDEDEEEIWENFTYQVAAGAGLVAVIGAGICIKKSGKRKTKGEAVSFHAQSASGSAGSAPKMTRGVSAASTNLWGNGADGDNSNILLSGMGDVDI